MDTYPADEASMFLLCWVVSTPGVMVRRFAVGGGGFLVFRVRSRGWDIKIIDLSVPTGPDRSIPIERELLNNSVRREKIMSKE